MRTRNQHRMSLEKTSPKYLRRSLMLTVSTLLVFVVLFVIYEWRTKYLLHFQFHRFELIWLVMITGSVLVTIVWWILQGVYSDN